MSVSPRSQVGPISQPLQQQGRTNEKCTWSVNAITGTSMAERTVPWTLIGVDVACLGSNACKHKWDRSAENGVGHRRRLADSPHASQQVALGSLHTAWSNARLVRTDEARQ